MNKQQGAVKTTSASPTLRLAADSQPKNSLVAYRLPRGEFAHSWRDWNGCLAGDADLPFARHSWVRIWRDSFAAGKPLIVYRARVGTHSRAYAPFIAQRESLAGLPCRLWEFPANAHTPRVEWAAGRDAATAITAVWRELRKQAAWDVLRFQNVRTDSVLAQTLTNCAHADGFLTMRWDVFSSPYIALHPALEPDSLLATKTRANLRRRRKKLAAVGDITLRCVSGGAGLDAALSVGFALEASGWKGKGGTAINCDAETERFYRALAHYESTRGRLALYFLDVAGEPIAFQYGLRYRDRYYLLKPGYLAAYAQYSPGQLLMAEVLRDLCKQQVREFDFLGHNMAWKREWTAQTRPHSWLFVLRPTLKNRVIYARYTYGPRVKAWLRKHGRVASRLRPSRWFGRAST